EQSRETVRGFCGQSLLERAAVLPRQDPGLERAARRVRHERRERRREGHDTLFGGDLLAEHVAVETAPFVLIVLARLPELAAHLVERDRDRAPTRSGNTPPPPARHERTSPGRSAGSRPCGTPRSPAP